MIVNTIYINIAQKKIAYFENWIRHKLKISIIYIPFNFEDRQNMYYEIFLIPFFYFFYKWYELQWKIPKNTNFFQQ